MTSAVCPTAKATHSLSDSSDHQTAVTWTCSSDDDASIGSHSQQIAELKALLAEKDQRIAELEAQVAAAQQPELPGEEEEPIDDDDDDDDSQVRDQIAAVKASLEQGRHQVQANQNSLNEEVETCRRLQQKLASRKDFCPPRSTPSPKKKSLTQQLAALVASVQEREQSMAEIAQSLRGGTIPVSLYQAEIHQWKQALAQLSSANNNQDNLQGTLRQSNQLLHQANEKLQQLESALTQAQQENVEEQARAHSLWQVVQKLEQDKQEEIHLLDIVMQHLVELEEEQQQEQLKPPKRASIVVEC